LKSVGIFFFFKTSICNYARVQIQAVTQRIRREESEAGQQVNVLSFQDAMSSQAVSPAVTLSQEEEQVRETKFNFFRVPPAAMLKTGGIAGVPRASNRPCILHPDSRKALVCVFPFLIFALAPAAPLSLC
jgi:hypothetical protein